ncbi:MAG: hypothetical protein JOY78_11260 [Pseudonocardia sp.]|nr:hypothetical protein [Pseudonocardia sp.]
MSLQAGAVAAAALILRLRTVGTFETIDEPLWTVRSQVFSDAIIHLHPSKASVTAAPTALGGQLATMPGVPTMWLGSLGRLVWAISRSLGIVNGSPKFSQSTSGLAMGQAAVAAATAVLIGLTVWLVGRWGSPRAGVVAGLFLATEPFWVAHGSVLHTDELTALFGLTGLLALGLVLGVPTFHEGLVHRRWLAVLAAFLLVCSPLTKISGLAFAPGALVLVGWAVLRAVRNRPHDGDLGAALRPLAWCLVTMAITAVVAIVVLWPALWASPSGQIHALRNSVKIGYHERRSFFRGAVRTGGTPTFFAWALPFRMTPWMLAGLVVGVPVALARRTTRRAALTLLAATVPVAYVLSTAGQQLDRYGLLILGPVCAVVGLAATRGPGESVRTATSARWAVVVGGVLATVYSLVVAPWGMAYYNPLLGGGKEAVEQVPVGWMEGQEVASRTMQKLQHGRCDGVTFNGLGFLLVTTRHCGRWTKDMRKATYQAIYVTDRQVMSKRRYRALTHGRKLVAVVHIRAIPYVELWRRR